MISGTNAISIKFTHHMKTYKTIAVAYFGSLDNFELRRPIKHRQNTKV